MTINDVLFAIANSLTSIKGRAALDHYPSLRVKTRVLNVALEEAQTELDDFRRTLNASLKSDSLISPAARTNSDPYFYFRQIVPRMLQNFLIILEQLILETTPFPPLTIDELRARGNKGAVFSEFNRLTTCVRQFIDNLIIDAYQFTVLEPKELVHQILSSVISFVTVAPASLQAPIVTPELQAATDEFSRMSKRQRRNSSISSVQRSTFPEKAKYLCEQLKPDYHHNILGNLNTVFSFCSEFTHVGYVPTLIASSDADGVFLGGDEDCYMPSHENLAKLRHQLLRECAIFLGDIYIPALSRMTESLLANGSELEIRKSHLTSIKTAIRVALNKTDYEYKMQPIAKGLKEQGAIIIINCGCGGKCEWKPPYHEWFAFCKSCGARFQTFEVSPLNLYALSAQGIGDVVGAAGPNLEQLSPERRRRATQICTNLKGSLETDEKGMQFAFIGNPDAFDDNGRSISGKVERVPPRGIFQIAAWVAQAAMNRSESIEIQCNCGARYKYEPPYSLEVVSCSSCGTKIGIYVVSGDMGYLRGGDDVHGQVEWRLYPLFGSIYKRPEQLSKEQYSAILDEMSKG